MIGCDHDQCVVVDTNVVQTVEDRGDALDGTSRLRFVTLAADARDAREFTVGPHRNRQVWDADMNELVERLVGGGL